MSKIKQFIELLESGSDKEAAAQQAGISPSTARVQFSKWKKSKLAPNEDED